MTVRLISEGFGPLGAAWAAGGRWGPLADWDEWSLVLAHASKRRSLSSPPGKSAPVKVVGRNSKYFFFKYSAPVNVSAKNKGTRLAVLESGALNGAP